MPKSTASVGCHLDLWNLQLTTACRSQMPAAVNAGDWLAEIHQVPTSHALSTLVHLTAQPTVLVTGPMLRKIGRFFSCVKGVYMYVVVLLHSNALCLIIIIIIIIISEHLYSALSFRRNTLVRLAVDRV